MSIKSGSTLVDVPSVTVAVQHLQELGDRMRCEEFGFNVLDVANIDKIIDAIGEVEHECGSVHDKLETTTIKASVLRHTLQFLPAQIKEEIQGAISAARTSNSDEVNSLQQQLKDINDNIDFQDKKHTQLEQENAVLHPEKDGIRQQHEEIIARLNQGMAEKASKQIILNETRDELRETNQMIVDMEEGILQLKEDLIQERADARMEKKTLKKAVYDTTMKTREQTEVNVTKKIEVDELQDRATQSELQLNRIRQTIGQFEASKSKLEGRHRALSTQYKKEATQNSELSKRGLDLSNQIAAQDSEFEQTNKELQSQIDQFTKDIKNADEHNQKMTTAQVEIVEILKEKLEIRREDEIAVKEMNAVLQDAKQTLAWKAEDAANLRQENMEMETRINELSETHESIISTFQKQIDEMRAALSKERKERMELQDTRDTVQKEADDFRVDTQKFINEVTHRINEGKSQHVNLTKEGTTLQRALRDGDSTIRKLQEQLSREKAEFASFEDSTTGAIKSMQTEIRDMTDKLKVTQDSLTERMPTFVELQQTHAEETGEWEQMKKDMVALKNKRVGLEDSAERAARDLDKMIGPQGVESQLQKETQHKRQEYKDALTASGAEMSEVERDLYVTGSKLKTVLEENDRFFEATDRQERGIAEMQQQSTEAEENTVKLGQLLDTLKGLLAGDWNEDDKTEQMFAERDQVLVENLGALLDKSENREKVIEDITKKLNSELAVLSQFLDNVARRRPKESRGSKKPNKAPVKSAKSQQSITSTQAHVAIETVAGVNVRAATPGTAKGQRPEPRSRAASMTPRHGGHEFEVKSPSSGRGTLSPLGRKTSQVAIARETPRSQPRSSPTKPTKSPSKNS